jgi:hypothetical protein
MEENLLQNQYDYKSNSKYPGIETGPPVWKPLSGRLRYRTGLQTVTGMYVGRAQPECFGSSGKTELDWRLEVWTLNMLKTWSYKRYGNSYVGYFQSHLAYTNKRFQEIVRFPSSKARKESFPSSWAHSESWKIEIVPTVYRPLIHLTKETDPVSEALCLKIKYMGSVQCRSHFYCYRRSSRTLEKLLLSRINKKWLYKTLHFVPRRVERADMWHSRGLFIV